MDGVRATGTEGYGSFRTLRRIIGLHPGERETHAACCSSRRSISSSSAFITPALAIICVSLSLATYIQLGFAAPSTSELSVLSVSQTTIGPSNATVTYTVQAKRDGTIVPSNQVSCAPLSGTTFTAIDTTVTCSFQDGFGQQINLSFKIRIDTTLPTASAPAISPNPASSAPTITSTATDSGTATSTIAAAEFFTDSIGANGAGTAMSASDGSFSSNSEGLTATMTPAAFNTLSPGSHTIYVHAKDGAGNWGTTTSATFVKDATAPIVTNVSSTMANGAYTTGTIPITITFSEAVTLTGIPQIQLETGATDRQATYASGSGTATLTFNYAVQAGDASTDLDYVETTSLTLDGGTIKDAAANNAVLTLPTPGGANSLGSNKGIVIDTTAPTVSSVTVSKALIKESDVGTNAFNVTITFSEVMKNTVTPTITYIPAGGVSSAPITLTTGTGSGFDPGNTIYTAIHNILDNNAQVTGIDVQVTNGQDAAGNVQISATPVDLFSIDTAVPAAPVINVPAASASVNSATPTISGTAEAGSTVTVEEGLATLGTAVATGGSWSLTSSSLIDGPHTITATANDTAGNMSPASAATTFTVDTVVPTTTTPVITPNPTNAAPAITATSTDPSPSTNVTQGEYFIDTIGTSGTGIAMSASDGLFNSASEGLTATMVSDTFTGLAQGTHTIYVHAKDGGGNWGSTTSSTFVKDTVAPTVTASPIGGTFGPSGTSVTLTSNETATIYFTIDETSPTTVSPTYSSPIEISITTTLKFFAKDTAGNSGTVQTQTYAIDATPPTVTPSPVGGTFNAAQTVTLTASEPSTIFYTTNGADPTTSSSEYSTPIAIPTTTTLKYFAKDTVGNLGAIQSQIYTIDTTPPTVTAAPLGGTYNTAQSVTLSASETATIYYSTNGATPTTSSPQYSTPIAISSTTTLKYFAKDEADNSGTVQTQVYSIDSVAPTVSASPTGGLYNTPQSVTLTSSETGTSIYYTTDGTTPTTSSPTYSTPIAISTTTTLKYFAKDAADNSGTEGTEQYTIDTVAPTVTASPAGGSFASSQSVTLSADEGGTLIYYTTDGADPDLSSPVYTSAIQLTSTTTLKFYGRDAAGNFGVIGTENYLIDTDAPTVTASPLGGAYNTVQSVTLTSSEAGTIYYTTDGTTPSETSSQYASPLLISSTTTLKFYGKDTFGNSGTLQAETYNIDTVAPTVGASPAGGSFGSTQSVTLTANEAATIYYTTNGSTPTTLSTTYSSPIQIASTTTLKFFGTDGAGNSGTVTTENYLIDTDAPTVTASPLGGSFNTAQSVTLAANEPSTIYYTTNGATPTTSSPVYSAPISVTASTTLEFFAIDTLGNSGDVETEQYIIDTEAPTVNASPEGGVYNTAQSVTLTASETATIYYTTNGATPTTSSPIYSSPIPFSTTTTLKFFGEDTTGNSGTVQSEVYTIDTTAPTVTASPIGGTFGPSGTSVTLTASEPSTIYYTTNGATPTTFSPQYSTPIAISSTTTLMYFAKDTADNSGTVETQVYSIDSVAPTVSASPTGGLYNTPKSVTLSSSETGTTIYYTTDSTTPTTSSSTYSIPIAISITTTLKFFGEDTAGNSGTVVSEQYTIDTVAPTTNASPSGGTYGSSVSVTLTASEAGTIFFTTDGTPPTTSSPTYSSPLQVSTTTTLKFFATDAAGNSGTVVTENYVVDTSVPVVSASPPGGIYNTAMSITLTASETATIYYTTDGDTPTESSAVYSSPISVTATTTLKFFGVDAIGNAGTIATEVYTIDTEAPTVTASPAGGSFASSQSVTLSADEGGTLIYYTTDGADPDLSSPVYTSAIQVTSTTTLKFYGRDAAGNFGVIGTENYLIDTDAPTVTASPPGGAYNTVQSVTLTASEAGTIYYTTNGSEPTTFSSVYSTPLSISTTTTLKFFAIDTLGNSGPVQIEQYDIDTAAPTVAASPNGGVFGSTQSVTLTANEAATIYYTTNGSTPTTLSTTYSSPIPISSTTTLKFFGKDGVGNSGIVVTENYVIDSDAPTVTASPLGGSFNTAQSVTLAASEPSTIYYTINGVTPTTSSPVYSAPISVTASTTLEFFAIDTLGNSGDVETEQYIIDTEAPTVNASPAGGLFNAAQSATLTASEAATIYYTTNGDTPTTSSSIYSSPIAISATTTLKFFAIDTPGNSGTVQTQVYTIDTIVPTVTASPIGGTFGPSGTSVTLTASEPSTIYYTTNGATPTTSSSIYDTPISISSTTTLKFFGEDAGGNSGTVVTENYVIDSSVPTVTASPLGGSYTSAQSVTLTASEPAAIYYTTDGSTPSTSSSVYSSALLISATTTLKFFAVDSLDNSGIVQTQVYTIDTEAPTVNASPASGVYNPAQSVTLTSSEPSTIYYTTNGATPSTASPVYSTPIQISATTTLKFFGKDTAGNSGTIVTEQYTIDTIVPTVTASPIGGTFGPSGTSVTLTASEPSTIYYTTNGATPTTSSSIYSSPIPISTTTTLKFFGEDTTGNSGTVQTQVYTIDNIPPIATASPGGGAYSSIQSVTLSSSESGSTIFYTTDGSTPSTSSSLYVSTPISVNVNKVIKFFGVDGFGNTGSIVTATYVLTGTSIQSATGTGTIALSTNTGSFDAASAISESSLPTSGKPAGITFPHGFVSFVVTGIPAGSSITLTETYPTAVPPNSQYWTVIGGTWTDLTSLVGSNNGDNIITLTLADGGLGDDDGLANGRIADPSGSGTISDNNPPTVTASPTGGAYSSTLSVILSANEPGTAIYYTTNGATPTTSTALYSGVPISISTDTTLKFFGKDPAGNNSPVSTEIYDINPAPAIVMQDTTATTGQSLYSGRQIFAEYATSTSTLVAKPIDSITIALKKSGTPTGTAQIGIINPDLSMKKLFATVTVSTLTTSYVDNEYKLPAGDVYTIQSGDRIGIKYTGSTSSSSNNISIMRDTNTADPFDGTNSHLTYYTSSWAMSGTTLNHDMKMTLKYSGGGGSGSDTTAPTVTASPVSGSYNAAQLVSVSANEPATIYYTLDGSTPTTSSIVYTGSPLSITTTTTLKFFGKDTAGNSGTVQTQVYTIDTVPPTVSASPAGGSYASVQSISLTTSESGTTIYFTTNGATPTTSSSVYSAPIQMTGTTTLKFFGKDAAGNSGSIVTEPYTITIPDTTAPTVTASPIGGTFGPSGTSVTLTSSETATIYYTTNGDTPTESSTSYSAPITISTTTTLKYFGKDTAGNPSSVQSQTYAIDSLPPTITASPPGGTYSSTQSVTLSSSESGIVIRYTINGIDPTSSSPQYSSPISISIDTTLKFYGTDSFGNAGSIVTETYDITTPPQPPGIVMQDTTTGGTGWGIYPTRPVLSEYVSSSSVLVGKQIDSITVNIKKSESTAVGTAQIGIINSDLSMKKVFASINISTLTTSYAPKEFLLPSGDNYTIAAGDRIGIKYTGGSSSSNYIAIMRDINTSDPYDGANTYLSYHTTSWTAQTTYDLVMTLKLID